MNEPTPESDVVERLEALLNVHGNPGDAILRGLLGSRDLEDIQDALTLIRDLEILQWCAEQVWEGMDIDGGDFQEEMVKRGLFVEVEADEQTQADWDTEVMYVTAWSPLALVEREVEK